MDEFLGVIKLFAGSFAPMGWLFCHGQELQINQHTAVFSLLGTTYGGNGVSTFKLPDLRGRVAVGTGSGLGLSNISQGQMWGTESVTLTVPQMPAHSHALNAFSEGGDKPSPGGNLPANTQGAGPLDTDYRTAGTTVAMGATGIGSQGGGQAHPNMQPSMGLNYIICIQGIYPSRS